jgi:hypothetical protein
MSLEEYFATGPTHERPIFEALMRHFATVGPVVVEPVSVGIFLKKASSFLEIRPHDRWEALWFTLARRASHPTIKRKVVPYRRGYVHVANVASPDDLDDRLLALLTEAYVTAPG